MTTPPNSTQLYSKLPRPFSKSMPPERPERRPGRGGAAPGEVAEAPDVRRTTPQQQSGRLFINREWYLQVDKNGFIAGLWYEGAFGCVVPMYHIDNEERHADRLALKIPRLLADTVRENEFIRHIVQTEARLVTEANRNATHMSGLVPTEEIARDVLRGRRDFRDAEDPLLAAQDGCVLLFSFRKGLPPRVVSVRFDEDRLVVFPPAAAEVTRFITREVWAELRDPNERHTQAEGSLQRGFREPYFFELPDTDEARAQKPFGPMCWTMSTECEPILWYSALPSIIYKWAPGTLQRAVSQRAHMEWRLVDHYDLHLRIARGIATLHSKALIHGDLRPANIMLMGEQGARERPEEYAVGDYGSFSVDCSRNGPAPTLSGHTMTGAGVSRQRTSMFYAPERRHGFERENADVAIVIKRAATAKYYLICLGWGSVLFAPGSTALRPELLEQVEDEWPELLARVTAAGAPGMHELPRDGDRLRLREYVFEVRASKTLPEMSLFLADRRYAQVLHERVAVYSREEDELADGAVITLPMYTEIHQWSAATDLYGVGTLALYTMFMSAVQRVYNNDAGGFDESVHSRFESMVAELIGRLGSVPDTVEFWGDLDLFWASAEQWAGDEPNPELQVLAGSEDTMVAFAMKTTNNLLRIKNMKFLLLCFRQDMVTPRDGRPSVQDQGGSGEPAYNLAHFLFFVHFLISCIHRRLALEAACGIDGRDGNFARIFCEDRCEKPNPPGVPSAAEMARQRLTVLQERVNAVIYNGFLVTHERLDFGYRAESEFRLQRRCNLLSERNTNLEQALEHQRSAAQRVLMSTFTIAEEFASQRFRFLGIGRFLADLWRTLDAGVRELDGRTKTLAAARREPKLSAKGVMESSKF